MAEAALSSVAELDGFSFFGLSHNLTEVQRLLERADHALASKTPRPEDAAIAEHKEELLDAQARLRRAMGALLEQPSLTSRERPLAEDFLQEQLSRLEAQAAGDAKAAKMKAVERLRELLASVRSSAPVPESREVRQVEASIKQLDAEWKEVSPLYDKWQAGRHNFKSNGDLQAFRRRYEDCKKARESSAATLHKALCAIRTGKAAPERSESGLAAGWSSVAKKAATASQPPSRSLAAGARQPAAAPRTRPGRWGSAVVSFAQRLRAEVATSVRDEVKAEKEAVEEDEGEEEAEEESDEEEEVPQQRPPPPPPVVPPPPPKPKAAPPMVAKRPPPLPPEVAAAAPAPRPPPPPVPKEDKDDQPPSAAAPPAMAAQYSASAKKKGKAKKRKGGGGNDEDEVDVPEPSDAGSGKRSLPQAPAWVGEVQAAFAGSLLQELLRQDAWGLLGEDAAEERLEGLTARLSWSSPLGLQLPLEWKDFVGLEVDGGPRRTSKRGAPQWVMRLQKNVPWLLAHYVTILFFVTLLHALSGFGMLFLAAAMQAGLLLAPPKLPHLQTPVRVLLLQASHMLVWLLFVRSLWQMHLLVKLLLVSFAGAHAYVVAGLRES